MSRAWGTGHRRVHWALAGSLALGLGCDVLGLQPAAAPTIDQCASANEDAQGLRRAGKLLAAKEKLALCVSPSCPAPVRDDCTERLTEVERATPTIVFAVKSSSGSDLTAVTLLSDDTVIADHVEGKAIAVDPGKHVFTARTAAGDSAQLELVVREGQKGRSESILFGPAAAGPPAAAPGASPAISTARATSGPSVSGGVAGASGATPAASASKPAVASAASGTASTDADRAAARLMAADGLKLAQDGDCASAIDKLTRVEEVAHSPVTAVALAQCEIKTGKLVAGTERLHALEGESLAPGAPRASVDAKNRIAGLLADAEPRLARLRVHVQQPVGAHLDVQVRVDDEPVAAALIDADRPTDPGSHRIVARATGYMALSEVLLAEGQSQEVTLTLAPSGPPVGLSTPPSAETRSGRGGPGRPLAYVSFGVGGAGVVLGSVTGIVAVAAKGRLNSACSAKVCLASSLGDIETLDTNAILSTIGWALGIAGAGTGTYFWLTSEPPKKPETARAEVHAWFGPTTAGLAGSFR